MFPIKNRRRCLTGLALCLSVLMPMSVVRGEKPNVLLIMVDDMGFSDLGCYGGEIETPILDRLAANGLRFSQFYNCAKCETTRATLISGQYHPDVGVGRLQNCVTLADVARGAGYTTLMTGKWHLSGHPMDWGFDHYFGHLSGACNFFLGDGTFRLERQVFKVPSEGFYTTDANTDHAIRMLKQAPKDRPFFLYIAYNAPHYPLQAPRETVEKYRGRFSMGWDRLREQRLRRLRTLGLVSDETRLSPRPDGVPAWDSLSSEDRATQELLMETYAAMVDRVDQNVGRLVQFLEQRGQLNNTLILFLSDNGACPFQRTSELTRQNNLKPWDPASYWTYDKGWAHACNTPFREYKRDQHEGGISTPLIAHWPDAVSKPGTITHQPGHLVDVMATLLDVADASYPDRREGNSVGPFRGISLRPVFAGQQRTEHDEIFFSFYGVHNALRRGNWKLVNRNSGPWELYDLARDREERRDLSKIHPDVTGELIERWKKLAEGMNLKKRKPTRKRPKGTKDDS